MHFQGFPVILLDEQMLKGRFVAHIPKNTGSNFWPKTFYMRECQKQH